MAKVKVGEKMVEKPKQRMSVKEIRKRLELEAEMGKKALEGYASAPSSFDTLRDAERVRARIALCNELLKEMGAHKKNG